MILRTGTKKKYRIWFLPAHREYLVAVSHKVKIISVNWLLCYKLFHKIKMTGMVNILWRIFEKSGKTLKIKSQDRKRSFLVNLTEHFLGPVTPILTFFKFSQKCAGLYRPFRSFCLSWNFFGLKLLWLVFASIGVKLNIFAIYKSIILIFSVNLPLVFINKSYQKDIQI